MFALHQHVIRKWLCLWIKHSTRLTTTYSTETSLPEKREKYIDRFPYFCWLKTLPRWLTVFHCKYIFYMHKILVSFLIIDDYWTNYETFFDSAIMEFNSPIWYVKAFSVVWNINLQIVLINMSNTFLQCIVIFSLSVKKNNNQKRRHE